MAKRKATRRIDSSEVMGEDSYVVLRAIKYKEAREAMLQDEEMTDEAREAKMSQLICDSIVSWDWVDDEGELLPLPKDGSELGDLLYTHEMLFLTESLIGSETERKN